MRAVGFDTGPFAGGLYNPSMTDGPIVIVGGHMAWPVSYRGMAKVLGELSGREVSVVPITPFDWALAWYRGYGQLVFEVATMVDRALLASSAEKAILVGHSAGGILSRVYVGGDPPYGGRRYSGHRRVSHLITLGTPHNVPETKALAPIAEVNELFPGALHAPAGLSYLSVAGAAVDGSRSGRARGRYERFVADGRVQGDGKIPVPSALLEGSENLVLDDVYHGRRYGPASERWYGSDRETIERWWPEKLRVNSSLVKESGA